MRYATIKLLTVLGKVVKLYNNEVQIIINAL
jgi:hypothetical protein